MLDKIRSHLDLGPKGMIITYLVILWPIYELIWRIIEPMSIPDKFESMPGILKYRITYQILITIFISPYFILILILLGKSKKTQTLVEPKISEAAKVEIIQLRGDNADLKNKLIMAHNEIKEFERRIKEPDKLPRESEIILLHLWGVQSTSKHEFYMLFQTAPSLIDYHLHELDEHEFIKHFESFEFGTGYEITQKGRNYVIKNKLDKSIRRN